MNQVPLQTIVDSLISDTLETSLPLFRPELVLCATIVTLLFARIISKRIPAFVLALGGAVIALVFALPENGLASWENLPRQEIFTGLLVYDTLTAYVRVFLLSFAVLFIILSRLTGIADSEDGQDYYVLVLGSTLGMSLMASSNHLLTVFLAIEMASVPSYVLAGIVKGRRRSSEASLKYAIYGAGTAGIMLYGLSLLAGLLGSAHLPTMAMRLAEYDIPGLLVSGEEYQQVMVLALAGLMVAVGIAFKLSAVPFHFWCPDVFEGASAEVDGFLSVASKGAAMALLLRVGLAFVHAPDDPTVVDASVPEQPAVVMATTPAEQIASIQQVAQLEEANEVDEAAAPVAPLTPVRKFIVMLVGVIAIVTCTFGNLAAYGQTNIKRMLAYSTIAHAGYMMMAIAAAIALWGIDPYTTQMAVSALLLYLGIYLFMNLGAFAIVAFLRNEMSSEEIRDYGGLIRSAPMTAVMMTAIMVSLIGLPPLAGFWPKLRVLQALYDAGGTLMIVMLFVAGINTAISLVYYLRVCKVMCIDEQSDTRGPVTMGYLPGAYIFVISVPVLIFGVLPDGIARWAEQASRQLLS